MSAKAWILFIVAAIVIGVAFESQPPTRHVLLFAGGFLLVWWRETE